MGFLDKILMAGYWGSPDKTRDGQQKSDGLLGEDAGGTGRFLSQDRDLQSDLAAQLLLAQMYRSRGSGPAGHSGFGGQMSQYDFSQISHSNHGGDPAVFQRAMKFVGKWEGGLANDPDDRGGRTMAGVTQGTYNAWRRQKGLPQQDVASSTPQERQQLYYENYYVASGAHRMSEPWALAMFDTAVNMGVGRAKELYAQSGGNMERFFELRERKYRQFAGVGNQGKFLNGWLNRLNDLERTVMMG